MRLYSTLQNNTSYFLTLGQPTLCVSNIPRNLPPYKCIIELVLPSLDDDIGITLLGVTSTPTTISGLPQSAHKFRNTAVGCAIWARELFRPNEGAAKDTRQTVDLSTKTIQKLLAMRLPCSGNCTKGHEGHRLDLS